MAAANVELRAEVDLAEDTVVLSSVDELDTYTTKLSGIISVHATPMDTNGTAVAAVPEGFGGTARVITFSGAKAGGTANAAVAVLADQRISVTIKGKL